MASVVIYHFDAAGGYRWDGVIDCFLSCVSLDVVTVFCDVGRHRFIDYGGLSSSVFTLQFASVLAG